MQCKRCHRQLKTRESIALGYGPLCWKTVNAQLELPMQTPNLGTAVVDVIFTDTGEAVPLVHHIKHSPDGFEWGYAGSGPSELARCILIHFFNSLAISPMVYQQFKWDMIARLSTKGAEIKSSMIKSWFEGHDGKVEFGVTGEMINTMDENVRRGVIYRLYRKES